MLQSVAFKPVRVLHIILGEDDPDYPGIWEKWGGWDGLGLIHFAPTNEITRDSSEISDSNVARPLYPNIKNYPLINEIVYIISLPNPGVVNHNNPYDYSYYYVNIVNVWNHPHHNALPLLKLEQLNALYSNNPNASVTYEMIQNGLSTNPTQPENSNLFGKTFKEKSNIKTLLPFEGDVIYEGRYGQSIRFGSTVTQRKDKNYWSSFGNDGDPITIIRNGQSSPSFPDQGWIPTVEDINKDGSSIYMCQNQVIPINVSSNNLKSFNINLSSPDIQKISISNNPPLPKSQDDIKPIDKTENIQTITTSTTTTTTTKKVYTENELNELNPLNTETEQFIVGEEDDESPSVEVNQQVYTPTEVANIKSNPDIVFVGKVAIHKKYLPYWEQLKSEAAKDGIKLQLNSAYRTDAQQLALRKQNVIDKSKINDLNYLMTAPSSKFDPVTSPPGKNSHQLGYAFDIQTRYTKIDPKTGKEVNDDSTYQWLLKNAPRIGFVRTVPSERWHWVFKGPNSINTIV